MGDWDTADLRCLVLFVKFWDFIKDKLKYREGGLNFTHNTCSFNTYIMKVIVKMLTEEMNVIGHRIVIVTLMKYTLPLGLFNGLA